MNNIVSEDGTMRAMGPKWVDAPCRICGRLLGDHKLANLQICWYFKELVALTSPDKE